MKRCIRWLISWFTQWVGKMRWEEKIGITLGVITSIVIGIMLFVSSDTTPATPMDYKPLEKQITAVQQNPHLLFETNCNIKVEDEVTTVFLENEECSITAKYDKNLKIISTSKADKSTPLPIAVILIGLSGVAICFVCEFLFTVLIYITEIAWGFISWNISLKFSKAKK